MSEIISLNQACLSVSPASAVVRRTTPAPAVTSTFDTDTIEFSRIALGRAVELSSLRIATTAAIRAEIEHGTYETPERIDGTVERLLDVIG